MAVSPVRLYRTVKARYAAAAFAGSRGAGRWHTEGVPMVYASDSPAATLLEVLVHAGPSDLAVPHVVDVSRQEKELRQACAALATELSFVLQGDGRAVDVRAIHAEAKRRFANKAQEQLSLQELARKRDWLEKCIRARRLV